MTRPIYRVRLDGQTVRITLDGEAVAHRQLPQLTAPPPPPNTPLTGANADAYEQVRTLAYRATLASLLAERLQRLVEAAVALQPYRRGCTCEHCQSIAAARGALWLLEENTK